MHMSKITADLSLTHCFAIIPIRQRELAREGEQACDYNEIINCSGESTRRAFETGQEREM
jgi:hypothetical protein